MPWRVVVWFLCLSVVTAINFDGTNRGKRFMTNDGILPTRQMTKYHSSNQRDQYKEGVSQPFRIYPSTTSSTFRSVSAERRNDKLQLGGEVIAREHAKLVHDINSLIESSPGGWSRLMESEGLSEQKEEVKDESIYMENFDSGLSTPIVKTVAKVPAVNLKIVPATVSGVTGLKPGIALPVIVVGGNAGKHQLKLKTATMKHPYPFVGSASTQRPAKIRPLTFPVAYAMRPTPPTLWERFVSIFPRLVR